MASATVLAETGDVREAGATPWPRPRDTYDRRLILPGKSKAFYDDLLHQQFWCFGADIRRDDPKLLPELGFSSVRAPEGEQGSATYWAELPSGLSLTLWGFGCLIERKGESAMYISRFSINPQPARVDRPLPHIWLPTHLEGFLDDSALDWHGRITLLIELARWFASYERFCIQSIGTDARQATLIPWGSRCVCPAAAIAEHWDDLASLLLDVAT